ncbi:hypothetical protein VNO77_12569 [Canavalia gladiata]|uniref:Uncharacterized protein n=1 Tax=Canavalia gladiata TaxID=3824 RepID=A0AAN9M1Q1_CANGL
MSFKKDKIFNGPYKPDQLGEVITEDFACSKRKVGNLKLQTTFSFKKPLSNNFGSKEEVDDSFSKQNPTILLPKPKNWFSFNKSIDEFHVAAIKLQKVYKGYRTRRNPADRTIVYEELWWEALDIAALNRCFISHWDSIKSETNISKWARARMMAAKVGKGLCKDDKAYILATRHWLEAKEREAYEVLVEGGRLVYRKSQSLVHTVEGSKWIFVLSSCRILYVGEKKKGQFHHSSFLAGGATIASGRLVAQNGVLDAIWPYSGHYCPTKKNFMEFIGFLMKHNVDLTNVKKYAVEDDAPPSKYVDEELQLQLPETNADSSDSVAAKNRSQHNVNHFCTNLETYSSYIEDKPLSSKGELRLVPNCKLVV